MFVNRGLINVFILLIFFSFNIGAQGYFVNGYIKDVSSGNDIVSAEIYDLSGTLLSISDKKGYFKFNSSIEVLKL